eukprot:4950886-Ditylum_brightwellii.AAC.1
MLIALSSIATEQNNGTTSTSQVVAMLLDYTATNPDTKIRFRRSDMILHIHIDASYLSEKKALSWGRESGHNQRTGVGPYQNLEMRYGLCSRSRLRRPL